MLAKLEFYEGSSFHSKIFLLIAKNILGDNTIPTLLSVPCLVFHSVIVLQFHRDCLPLRAFRTPMFEFYLNPFFDNVFNEFILALDDDHIQSV